MYCPEKRVLKSPLGDLGVKVGGSELESSKKKSGGGIEV